jgi:cytidylate kinase
MKYNIIAIEREYASGGRTVGALVGELLGMPVYGREILELAAEKGNTTPAALEHLEETVTNSLLYSLLVMGQAVQGKPAGLAETDKLTLLEGDVVRELSKKGSGIFVGRCAGWTLRERKDVLRVFLHAEEEQRLRRAVEEYGVEAEDAKRVLRRFDHRRSNFYQANTGIPWKEKRGYHMVLDTGLLGISTCAQLIAQCAKG